MARRQPDARLFQTRDTRSWGAGGASIYAPLQATPPTSSLGPCLSMTSKSHMPAQIAGQSRGALVSGSSFHQQQPSQRSRGNPKQQPQPQPQQQPQPQHILTGSPRHKPSSLQKPREAGVVAVAPAVLLGGDGACGYSNGVVAGLLSGTGGSMDLHQGPVASRSAASRSAPRGAVASASAASGVTPQKSSGSSAEARKKVPPLSSMSLTKPPPELPPQLRTDFEGDPELLGEGAFAVVRRLRHRRTKEIVALKVVEKYPLHIRNMLPQLQREVRIQGNLRHRHILHLHSCLEDDSYVYMLLEHCAGGSLRKLCMSQPNHRLHEAVACRYFAQICQGVDYMHQHLCVHRDLKPENMLLAADDEVRICDFGWSAEVQMEQALRTTCGTPHCWPPELFEGESQDVGVDLWALGTMCYELVVGHAPFWGDMEELRRKVLAVDLRYPPNVLSKPAINLCHCLMQRDPRSRVSANRLLAEHPWVRQGLSASGACPAPLTPTTLLPAPIAAVGFTSASAAERPAATISAPATRASHLLNAGLGGSAEAAVGPISTPKLAMNPLPTSKSWDFGSVSGLGSAPVEEATLIPSGSMG